MLLVETYNNKEQLSLEEEFSREGNLFAIPVKKTSQIQTLLQGILFEIFGQTDDQACYKQKLALPMYDLIEKMNNFLSKMLKLNFSLTIVREMFQVIKMYSVKIKLYEQYIKEMNKRFMNDIQQEDDFINCSDSHPSCIDDQQIQFQDEMNKNKHYNTVNDSQFRDLQCQIELQSQTELKQQKAKQTGKKQVVSMFSINCNFDSPKDEEARTMHTLKSQFTSTSPKFSLTPLAELQLDKLKYKSAVMQLDDSFHFSESNSQTQDGNIANSKNNLSINKNVQIFYCPEWKKNEEDQKKNIKNALSQDVITKKKSSNQSNFLQNLSGRVHPLPSFLHDQSIAQMIIKQKKQDIRRSNIFKNSMKGIEEKKKSEIKQAYNANLRMIKFQNKLRRNSRKGLAQKKDIKQLNQQLQSEQQKIEKTHRKQKQAKQQMNKINEEHPQNTPNNKIGETKQAGLGGKKFSFFKSPKY